MGKLLMADPFVDDRHALYVGWCAGIAMRHGLKVRPVMDGDDYTDRLSIVLTDELSLEVIVPYPPDEWEMTA
jgi:hypothetical protein